MSVLAAALVSLLGPSPSVEDVLEHVRKAVHYEAFSQVPRGISMQGKGRFLGLDSGYEILFSQGGEYLERISSDLTQVHGFDGKTTWEVDRGVKAALHLEDKDNQNGSTWLFTHYWLSPKSPFTVKMAPGNEKAGYNLTLTFKNSPFLAKVHVDGSTWLPSGALIPSDEGDITMTFTDWRPELGLMFPHHMESVAAGSKSILDLTAASEAPVFVRNPYEFLPAAPADTTFSGDNQVECKKAFTGHILVHPLVNGKDVGWFIFDSGAGAMCIDQKVADDLGMPKMGEIPASGIGGIVMQSFRKADTFTLGPATYKNPVFVQFDLSSIGNAFGVKLAGLVGYDFLSRAVVEMDLNTPRVAVYDPAQYQLKSGTWQPLILSGKHPTVNCEFEGGRSGRFRIDTGADGTVQFSSPFVKQFDLLKGREVKPAQIGGTGGMETVYVGTLAYFKIGGKKFVKPDVMFTKSKEGPLANKYLTGNLGHGFLNPFTLVFDYPDTRLALVPKD